MYWRSEKEIIEDFVKVLRRVFTYVETLTNKDKELVTLPTGSITNNIFESFASINEEYPQIRIDSGGMTFVDHLNNLITVNAGAEIPLGSRPLKKVIISNEFPIKTFLPSDLNGTFVRGFVIPHANINPESGSEDMYVELKRTNGTQLIIAASGSLAGNPSSMFLKGFAPIYPTVEIVDNDYLEITPETGDQYIVGVDEDAEANYIYYENGIEINAEGSLCANAVSPGFIRIGAGLEGSILIKCSSKDDSKTARNLASIAAIYCNLLKQTQIRRKEAGYYADKLQLIFGADEAYDEWLEKGIRIKNIRQNPINYRRRSSNEIIYESIIVVDVATEWFQDFQADTLEKIDVDIYSMLLQQINATVNKDTVIVRNNEPAQPSIAYLDFSGSSTTPEWLSISPLTDLGLGNTTFTMQWWMNVGPEIYTGGALFGNNVLSTSPPSPLASGWQLHFRNELIENPTNGYFTLQFYDKTSVLKNVNWFPIASSIFTGFNHFCITVNFLDQTAKLYINGVQQGGSKIIPDLTQSIEVSEPEGFWIGSQLGNGGNWVKMLLGEIQFLRNKALTTQEIYDNYQRSLNGHGFILYDEVVLWMDYMDSMNIFRDKSNYNRIITGNNINTDDRFISLDGYV